MTPAATPTKSHQELTSAYGLSDWIEKPSAGVAAANFAAAESVPFFPHSYELTPHCRRNSGTCMVNEFPQGDSQSGLNICRTFNDELA